MSCTIDPQVRKYGELVRGEGRRLTEMVEQILELAGIQSGQRGFALDAGAGACRSSVDVVHASSTLIEQAGLAVEYDIPETLPPVLGDEQALRRVFQNLVGNAIKYGAGGGWIGDQRPRQRTRGAGHGGGQGMGIEAAEQAKIFEPFYRDARTWSPHRSRAPASASAWCSGSSRRTAAASPSAARRARAASSPCTCRRPPRSRPPRSSAAPGSRVPEPDTSSMKRILLVEDEPGLVLTLSDRLTREGYAVETAADGESGLERAAGEAFDLVLLDVMLPRLGGFDVLKELRKRNIETPVIMLTARGQVVDKVVGLKLGADDYVTKPFEMVELLARIEAKLRRAPVTPHPTEGYQFGGIRIDFRRAGDHERRRAAGAVGARVPAAQVLHRASRRDADARGAAQRGLGLQLDAVHPHRRRPRRLAAPEDRAQPPPSAIHPHRPRDGV